MNFKNINLTTNKETVIPVYYIDRYEGVYKDIVQKYKFKNEYKNNYLLNILMDLCIDMVYENKDSYVIFTYPPSTMFYRKEKKMDSVGNLILQVKKSLNFYWRQDRERYYFKSLFSIDKKYLKHNKARHIDGNREIRIRNLNKRYYINFWNKSLIKDSVVIVIIDDISSTGGTLLACKNTLEKYIQNKKLNNIEIFIYSLLH